MQTSSDLPLYYHSHSPHNCRRARFHNYKAPGYYMITVSKHPKAPVFSYLVGDATAKNPAVSTNLTPLGRLIESNIAIIDNDPKFEVPDYVIMPDHIHILWRVKEWLVRDLGYFVGLFKSRCTHQWRETLLTRESQLAGEGLFAHQHHADGDESHFPQVALGRCDADLFEPKFNDKIIFDGEMWKRYSNYIADNPRRRQLAIQKPGLFRRALKIKIEGVILDVYGNFQLLKHPLIAAAIVSSRYSPDEAARLRSVWEETIRQQGVLVSPFISKAEKELMHRAIENGASIIRIIPDGIGPRYKPAGKEFDLCAEGRCLHLGIPRPSAHKDSLSREQCLAYNRLANWIASHPAEVMHLLHEATRR